MSATGVELSGTPQKLVAAPVWRPEVPLVENRHSLPRTRRAMSGSRTSRQTADVGPKELLHSVLHNHRLWRLTRRNH